MKTFQAAKIGGVKNYFVEQNMELTKESVAYLKTLTSRRVRVSLPRVRGSPHCYSRTEQQRKREPR